MTPPAVRTVAQRHLTVPPAVPTGATPPAVTEQVVGPSPARGNPALSLVITTIGRPRELSRLLDSIDASTAVSELEVVLVDQGADRASTALFRQRPARYSRKVATSPPGAGAGRRVGLALSTAELVGIPNDNCWYGPRLLEDVIARFSSDSRLTSISGRQVTADGRDSALRWSAHSGPVTRTNFDRRGIASTQFFRRDAVLAAGSVSGAIGTGSLGPYQAGEESDLILRLIAAGQRVLYDPALVVYLDEPRDDPDSLWPRKMLVYGRGHGHLWRMHELSRAQMAYRITRKMGASALHAISGSPIVAKGDFLFAAGWADGFRRTRRRGRRP